MTSYIKGVAFFAIATDKPGDKEDCMLAAYIRARTHVQALREREDGQALVEYALILSLVTVGAVVILGIMGGKVSGIFTAVSNDF